jgi:hypothetical protein
MTPKYPYKQSVSPYKPDILRRKSSTHTTTSVFFLLKKPPLKKIMYSSKISARIMTVMAATVVAENCFVGYLYCSGNLLSQGKS